MIRRAAWAGLISVKRAKPPRWVPRNIAPIPLRTLASGPAAATEDLWTNSVGQAWDGVQKVSSQERADGALYTCGHQHPHRHEALAFARESIKRNALDTRVRVSTKAVFLQQFYSTCGRSKRVLEISTCDLGMEFQLYQGHVCSNCGWWYAFSCISNWWHCWECVLNY